MRVPFLDLQAQYESIKREVDPAVAEVIGSASFVGGSAVTDFEQSFAKYLGVAHCVGVGNGTDALEIALKALQLPAQGEVVVPANSFIGSSEAVTNAGLRVRFCDVDDTYTLDPEQLLMAISSRTVALMPVHLYGQPADMEPIMRIARDHGLRVVEDCAQAHGAEYQGRRVGTFGDAAAFSFYPGKNLGAYGDGGAIVTNADHLARRSRMIANHGRIAKYDHEFEGRNSRLDSIQAAVLSVKLIHLDEWTARRREVAREYCEGLIGVGDLELPRYGDDRLSAHHLFPVRTQFRDQLRHFLTSEGIGTGIHYPRALPSLAAYAHTDQQSVAPRSVTWATQLLSLSMGEHLSDEQVTLVVDSVRRFFAHNDASLPV